MHVQVAPFAAGAAHNIRDWKLLDKYLHAIPPSDEDGNFYRAISCVSRGSWADAKAFIVEARKQVSKMLMMMLLSSPVSHLFFVWQNKG